MSAPASTPAPAAGGAREELDRVVRDFARAQLGRELGQDEQQVLAAYVALVEAQSPAPATASRGDVGNLFDSERQQIQEVIRQSLQRAQSAVASNARAGEAAEREVLGVVERAQSLQDLIPPKPAPGAPARTAPATPMEQIAVRLGELVREEVQACFQREIGPLARQLQQVIDAARANGVLPDTGAPAQENDGSASSDESRATARDSADAVRPDRDDNSDSAAQANGGAASQGKA